MTEWMNEIIKEWITGTPGLLNRVSLLEADPPPANSTTDTEAFPLGYGDFYRLRQSWYLKLIWIQYVLIKGEIWSKFQLGPLGSLKKQFIM